MAGSRRPSMIVVAALTASFLAALGVRAVVADTVKSARAAAFGVQSAPVPINELPNVEAAIPPGPDATASDSLLEVPADPLATSFTANVQADASVESRIEALLQATMEGQANGLPKKHNARGYAITEDLEAVADQVAADVIESEAVASCAGGKMVFATGTRIANLRVAGQAVPLVNPGPNQVVFNQAGITITYWETNWDPARRATTDGSNTVFVNALHVKAPGGIDLILSHAEASAVCAGAKPPPPKKNDDDENAPQEAPPAAPVERQPIFTG